MKRKKLSSLITIFLIIVALFPLRIYADTEEPIVITADNVNIPYAEYGDISTASVSAVNLNAKNNGVINVKTGNVTSTNLGDKNTVTCDAEPNGNITLVTGDVESDNVGMYVHAQEDSTINITSNNISSEGESGIRVISAKSNVTLTSNSITGDMFGLHIAASDSGINTFIVNGSITTSSFFGVHVSTEDKDTSTTINVTGGITGKYGVNLIASGSGESSTNTLSTLTVTGDINATDCGISTFADGYGKSSISVIGNVLSQGNGMSISIGEDGLSTVIVKETVSSEDVPVLIADVDDENAWNNTNIYAWKIEPKDEVVAMIDIEHGDDVRATDFEKKNIHYYIRVKPTEHGTIEAVDANGNPLNELDDVNEKYANFGEIVKLKVTLDDGYELTGAFNGIDEVETLEKNDDGEYFISVPNGGGVYLSAKIEPVSDGEEEPDTPTPAQDDTGYRIPKTGIDNVNDPAEYSYNSFVPVPALMPQIKVYLRKEQ